MTQPLLTINLAAAVANWRALDVLSGGAETAVAVKADGYGCGAAEIATALQRAGCRTFFVATVEEGVALRAALAEPDIHILNGIAGQTDAIACIDHRLHPCLNHLGQIGQWRRVGGGACTLQVDSAMSRLGLAPCEVAQVPEGLNIRLILSHLACSDNGPDHAANPEQHRRFTEATAALRARAPHARLSLAATGGTFLGPDYHFDMVRCGIGIYGGLPFGDALPVVTLSAPILQLREIPAGQSVGYGWTWTAERPSRIATVPVGYADGLNRALSNRATFYISGRAAPMAGRVSMDLITLDVTDHPQVQVGDPVEILGPRQTVDDLAAAAGTIGYEILTSLGHRYAKRYTNAK